MSRIEDQPDKAALIREEHLIKVGEYFLGQAQEAQQAALDKAGDLSRDVLVENTKIKVETVKFAIQRSEEHTSELQSH